MPQLCLMGFLCSIQACCATEAKPDTCGTHGHAPCLVFVETSDFQSVQCGTRDYYPKTNIDLLRCYFQDCVNLF